MAEIPEELLRRSAEARAAKEGRDVEDILAEMRGEGPPAATAPPVAAPPPPPPGGPTPLPPGDMPKIPESLLRRTAEIRSKAEGREFEEVLAELRGGAPAPTTPTAVPAPAPAVTPPAAIPPAAIPPAAIPPAAIPPAAIPPAAIPPAAIPPAAIPPAAIPPAAIPPAAIPPAAIPPAAAPPPPLAAPVPEPVPVAAAAASTDGPDLASLADQTGVPAHLLERSFRARAKAEGRDYVAPGAEGAAPTTPQPAAPTAGGGAAPAVAAVPAIPEGVRTQRLLTVVRAGAIQQIKKEPTDKVNTWPHLVAIEFVALMVVTAALFVFSVFVDAPLLEFANFNDQPNPSKAPWYFLGLQELLSYFDPQVAGVIIPGFGLAGLAFIPYIDRNPSVRPSDRKLAIMIFTFFVMAASILTIFGSFFRGPGFNFVFPWVDGVFFDF